MTFFFFFCSVVSDSLQPHGLWPTMLVCPWDFPGNSTGVGCHFLLQTFFLRSVLSDSSTINFLLVTIWIFLFIFLQSLSFRLSSWTLLDMCHYLFHLTVDDQCLDFWCLILCYLFCCFYVFSWVGLAVFISSSPLPCWFGKCIFNSILSASSIKICAF